jgi:hypothetical protein
MFRISEIRNEKPLGIPETSWEKRVFPSSLAGRSIIYSDPDEFHMGATSWKFALSEEGNDITKSHPKLGEAEKDGGFLLPASFQPWSPDGSLLAIPTWKAHHFLYNVSQKRIAKSPIEGLVDSLSWSPTRHCFFAVLRRHIPVLSQVCFLSDVDGRSVQLNIQLLHDESAHFWWVKDGQAFIALYRDSKHSSPVIELFDSQSAESIAKTLVDPVKLVPYEEAKYQNVSRIHFSLELSPSTWCAGYFLDTWHKCHFDAEMNRLSLSIYRPSGEPILRNQQAVLPVKESWCTLQLEF